MIVPMKHLTLLCVASEKKATLEKLRELGVVHVNFGDVQTESFQDSVDSLHAAERALRILVDREAGKPFQPSGKNAEAITAERFKRPLPEIDTSNLIPSILAVEEEREAMINMASQLEAQIIAYEPYGNFDPETVKRLEQEGFTVRLFRATSSNEKLVAQARDTFTKEHPDGIFRLLDTDSRATYGVVILRAPDFELPSALETVELPSERISTWEDWRERAFLRTHRLEATLMEAVPRKDEIKRSIGTLSEQAVFEQAFGSMQSQGAVSWITGWIPADEQEKIRDAAHSAGWGILLRDSKEGELPPTLLRPPKIFQPVVALFKGLGIAPAYSEADVSVPFFGFFSIFFAMLVGDGGYGLIILALTLFAWHKAGKKAPKSWFILLTCFSAATIIWGLLSNTWFGVAIPFLDNPAARWLGDESYHNIMLVCFSIGVTQLSLARLWNAVCLFPDTKFLAEIGWIGTLWFMYIMTCNIVGIFPEIPKFAMPMITLSAILLLFFSVKPSELKQNGIALGMLPLNIVGSLGDIISYVRLFAVGLASVKVAQNFNDMAIGLNLPIWLKIVPLVLILLVGHGLNFAMAGLSVLVHAVRLNTLEFSNHKGITWSGFAFHPFHKQV
ncbi:MAG: hypothetical protein IKR48_10085 [Kiritimatiellae bacterium]|nr:hypothetical protein [Kiritimatiellia bacterium]